MFSALENGSPNRRKRGRLDQLSYFVSTFASFFAFLLSFLSRFSAFFELFLSQKQPNVHFAATSHLTTTALNTLYLKAFPAMCGSVAAKN
jgi:hypothetical protein